MYDNKGSSLRTANYLAKEAKNTGEVTTFFGTPGSAEKTLEEVVALLDGNVKGLGKDDATFYSLVLSPSPEELAYIGNDSNALTQYTQNVMQEYAKNFTLKNGEELGEPTLVWAARIHQDRTNRGTDAGVQGEKKDGWQTHVHVIVSARDADQKLALNPLGTPDRFNRRQFQAKAAAQLELQFGRVGIHDSTRADPTRKQLIAEKAAEIIKKAAATKRAKKPLTEQQLVAKDARLDGQVARLNSKLDPTQHLDPARVQQVAKQRSYDNIFYATLGKLERNAEKGTYTPHPYDYLATGRVSQPGQLRLNAGASTGDAPAPTYPQRDQEPELTGGVRDALAQASARLSRTLIPQGQAPDVRRATEKQPDAYEWEG